MTIPILPTAPTRSMAQDDFDAATAAWIAALAAWTTEANATAAAMNLNSTTDTSATSNTIGTGSKTFTVSAGKSFVGGMWLIIADTAAPSANSMFVQVTSYSGTSLVVNCVAVAGSGTKTAWTISQSSPAELGGLYAALAGSASQVFSVGTPTATTHAMNLAQFVDGWINSLDTWECTTAGVAGSWNANGSINVTPVSAIFRIVGADRTATFFKGVKVKFTQSSLKFGYVLSSTLSGSDTIVTMMPNADYIMGLSSGTAITAPAFSFGNPQGFPVNISYVALVAAVGGAFTSITPSLKYSMCGSVCTLHASVAYVDIGTATTGTYVDLPMTAVGAISRAGCGSEQAAVGHALAFGGGNTTRAIIQKYDATASLANGYANAVTLNYE